MISMAAVQRSSSQPQPHQQQQEDDNHHQHSSGCLGCNECSRIWIRKMKIVRGESSAAYDVAEVPPVPTLVERLKRIHPSTWAAAILFLVVVGLSATIVGLAAGGRVGGCTPGHYFRTTAPNGNGTTETENVNAIIPLSTDPWLRNIQLWKLHNSMVHDGVAASDEGYSSEMAAGRRAAA
jgi:hypothetical protein